MQVIVDPKKMLAFARGIRSEGKQIGFVPTMGSLHEGHLSLIRRARAENELVVCSIFVNPTQFSPDEDFASYPRDKTRDEKLAAETGVDCLFVPQEDDLYPKGYLTFVKTEKLGDVLCGAKRPAHFRGVATIVAKLFNLVKPDNAYFGQKDAQQFVIIRRMVEDLNFDVQLHLLPIVRDNDGLALSSRNQYLNPSERKAALALNEALNKAQYLSNEGVKDSFEILTAVKDVIAAQVLARLDYAAIVDMQELKTVKVVGAEPVLLALAVYIGQTRLIDNLIFNREKHVI